MKKAPVYLLWLLAGLTGLTGLTSCEKMVLKADPVAEPMAVFDHLWTDINNRYSYLEVKNINWDSIGAVYRNRITAGMDDKELFSVLAEMLFNLEDGHVNLLSKFNRSRNWDWFQRFPDNYNQNIIDSSYLKKDYAITGPLRNQVIGSILYINYRSFGDKISQDHLEELMERAEGKRGVIIDVRHNGGGNLNYGNMLASCFIDTSYVYAFQRFKNGPGEDDFTSWGEMTINPREGKRFNGPVVLLTNRRSYSASTFFAQMMRVVPHATLIGDNTGGGGGIPVFGELPNGWHYRFSATQTITPEDQHIETEVPVDIRAAMLPDDEAQGIDTIIETALAYLQSVTPTQ